MNYHDKKMRYFLDHTQVQKTDFDLYQEMINDHEEIDSLQGHRPSDFDSSLALNIHEDNFHPLEFQRIHSDEELERTIREILHSSKLIDGRDLSVSVRNTNVKVSGSVKSQFERDYVLSLVKLVHGIGSIKGDIIVKLNPGILPTDIGRNP